MKRKSGERLSKAIVSKMLSAFSLNQPPSADTLRVMIATDNHLGFLSSDPIRGEDSFDTMDEILQTARRAHCDCVFLAGDLVSCNNLD